MNPSTAYGKLKSILKAAGLPDIRFHDLRYPYVKLTTKKYVGKSKIPCHHRLMVWDF